MKETNSRKHNAVETKKKIYETALELFKKEGFNSITVDSIVEKAGVAKGTFYVYYESKDSLIADYVNHLDLGYEDFLTSLSPDISPSSLLVLLSEKVADVISNDIGYDVMKILYSAYLAKTIYTDPLLNYNRKLNQIYRSIVEMGVQQGAFKADLNVDSVSNHCVMGIRGMTYEWCIRFPDFNLKENVLQHIELLLSGIKI